MNLNINEKLDAQTKSSDSEMREFEQRFKALQQQSETSSGVASELSTKLAKLEELLHHKDKVLEEKEAELTKDRQRLQEVTQLLEKVSHSLSYPLSIHQPQPQHFPFLFSMCLSEPASGRFSGRTGQESARAVRVVPAAGQRAQLEAGGTE